MDLEQAGSSGGSGVRMVIRRSLYDKMQEQNFPNFEEKLKYLETYLLSCEDYSDDEIKNLKQKFSYIKSEFKQRWKKAAKIEKRFLQNNDEWLQKTFEIPRVQKRKSGRPSKSFTELSERSKRRKTVELRSAVDDDDLLMHATQTKLQTSGKGDASNILKQIISSPKRATNLKKAYENGQEDNEKQLTPLLALSVFVEADLSRWQYEIFSSASKKLYPSYSSLQKAKSDCYPRKESYEVTETCAEVNLQDLLNHTVTRLLTCSKEVIYNLSQLIYNFFNLIYQLKIILEVISSGHKIHLQKFTDYCIETAKLYVRLYPWHPMTSTMHKILVHGATVVEKALLPIGLLSEEAAEARNKHFRLYMQNFARKFSRELCNLGIINRLLLSSDPLITSLRRTPKKKTMAFTKDAIGLLIPAEPHPDNDDSDSDEVSEDEESEQDDEEPWHSSSS